MIEIKKYDSQDKFAWDGFLTNSRVDTFLFYRDFMDYHSDRFTDNSYLFYRKGKIAAILPGNVSDSVFYSHQGLTYGGFVTSPKLGVTDIMELFKLLNFELSKEGIKEVVYKPTPFIYHLIPSQEDIYALFLLNAKKIGCNISSTIKQINKLAFTESRKSGIRKAKKTNVEILESEDFYSFWEILENNLKSIYGKKPVHNVEEMILLYTRFKRNIKLYLAKFDDTVVGGCVLFLMKNIVHVQYIAANGIGKNIGALDLLFDKLINEIYFEYQIFDFGQSTEQMGIYLNENLIFQKEGFGGRGIVYEIYEYLIQ